jgi:long-chain acyl-CoA synthetase
MAPVTMQIPVIARLLDRPLATHPAATAVIARSGALSFTELDAAAAAAAGALWMLGVRPGDRVTGCLPNDLDIVVAFHGAQRIGAVWAGIGESLTEGEQRLLAELVQPAVVLAGPRCMLDSPAVVGPRRWAELVMAGHRAPRVDIDPHAPAGIAFSSGTTGAPKAIVHSQYNLVLPAAVLVATRGWGPDLCKGDSLPFTILNMLVLSTLVAAQAAGCTVAIDRRDPDGVAEWIQRAQVSVWNGAPAQLFDLGRRPDLDLTPLTEVWTGGGSCPEHVREAFLASHGTPVTATYGLSEAPTVVAIDPVGGHREGASGKVLPHLCAAAYDGNGVRLPAGDSGELGITSATTGTWAGCWRPPLGYWEDGALRRASPDALMTGDIGSVDDSGWLAMVDRKKLMIVRGGANVSPAEIESVLLEHPAVRAAVVFGVPDERLGERIAALVVPTDDSVPDAASLSSFCGRELARYKIPEVWARSASLPTNAMGKIIRTDLVARLRASTPL